MRPAAPREPSAGIELAVTVVFYKPCGVVSQFNPLGGHKTLAGFGLPKGVYPCGRLDWDSEGLLVLTDDGRLQSRLSEPRYESPRTYWAQVERLPGPEALALLAKGIVLSDGPTKPCRLRLLEKEPELQARTPPIRLRKNVPTAWLEITLAEGRNRQVRRMTAAVGHPTLRLVRVSHGPFRLQGLQPGDWRLEKSRREALRLGLEPCGASARAVTAEEVR